MAQTFPDWRIILVDDGSNDDTPEIVHAFVEQLGPKLKYIRQPNKGLPTARNTAIRNSSGAFLALLDADDVWLPERLLESLACFEGRPHVGLAYGLISRIDSEGQTIDTWEGNLKHAEGRIAPYIYMRRVHLPCPTITFRRSCVDEVGLFDESMRSTEDRDLWFRIALHYDVSCVRRVIAYYRISPNSMSSNSNRMLDAQLQFIRKYYRTGGCGVLARRIALSVTYKEHAEAHSQRGQLWTAWLNSMRALASYPFDMSNAKTAGSLLLRCASLKR